MTEADAESTPATPARKPTVSVCVCKNGQFIVRDAAAGAQPPKSIFIPMNANGDTRLFIDRGKLVRPYVVIEFGFRRRIDVSGIDIALYHEVAVEPFDPRDMQPVALHSLEEVFNERNAPKA